VSCSGPTGKLAGVGWPCGRLGPGALALLGPVKGVHQVGESLRFAIDVISSLDLLLGES